MRFLFNPVTNEVNAAPPRDTIYSDAAPVAPPFGTRWCNTLELREYLYIDGTWVEVGVGPAGIQGEAATIDVGSTTTTAPGTNATVSNSGTTSEAVFNFTLPRGDKGDAAIVAVGSTTTSAAGSNAEVTNSGTSTNAVLNFKIPQGIKGDAGNAATVTVGSTATSAEGTSAAVTNSGTTSNAVFNFTVPRGNTGSAATVSVGSTATGAAGTNATVTNSGTSAAAVLNFTIPTGVTGAKGADGTSITLKGSVSQVANLPSTGNTRGDLYVVTASGDGYVWNGTAWSNAGPIRGPQGAQATIAVGLTTTGAAGANAAVTNTGSASAAVLNFTIPQGVQGVQGVKGDTGSQGVPGPAPSGTGVVAVIGGALTTPVQYGSANVATSIVQRDTSGNFSAGVISANLTGNVTGTVTGNASSATKLATARTLNVSGDVTGTVQSFDGSTNIVIPTAIAPEVIVNADISPTAAIVDTKLATISTTGKVLNSATTATSTNAPSTIVSRDVSGNFSGGTFSGNVTGTVTGNATNVTDIVAIANGGTGSNTAAQALLTLGAAAASHTHPYSQITDSPYKDGVTVATTAALLAAYAFGTSGVGATLTNTSTRATLVIDGVTTSPGMRVLVKNQANPHNGIYSVTNSGSIISNWVLTRATDSDTNTELGGAIVSVDRGTSGGKLFSTSFRTTDTVGTTACLWQQIYDQGDGILLAPWVTKSGAYTAVAGDRISANTTAAAFTIVLPTPPAQYTEIVFADHYNQWATRNLTIAPNGLINGLAENLVCNVAGLQITLRYEGTTWRVYT